MIGVVPTFKKPARIGNLNLTSDDCVVCESVTTASLYTILNCIPSTVLLFRELVFKVKLPDLVVVKLPVAEGLWLVTDEVGTAPYEP